MQKRLETILRKLITAGEGEGPLTGIEIAEQFRPEEATPESALRNLNAAFLITLCGRFHPFYSEAERFIEHSNEQPVLKESVEFYKKSRSLILAEIKKRFSRENEFREKVNDLFEWIKNPRNLTNRTETMRKLWTVFFPEGVPSLADKKNNIRELRKKRSVRITRLNPQPIKYPANEVLFTSNVLLTVPSSTGHIDSLALPKNVKSRLGETIQETQRYWYDHPIQIGVEAEKNEIIYGLRGLDEAIAFEKERGVIEKDVKVQCVLSVSVTHEGLHELAKPYLEAVLKRTKGIHHLRVCVMTDSDVSRLINDIFSPAASYYMGRMKQDILHEVLGVDGEYGRHYTFLKSISAFWQVFMNPAVRGTFKIDLDQVFPENELVRETGSSALEHLKTPLWGAEGMDGDGNALKLGMIAGALVNEKDISHSLFTPDVIFSTDEINGDEWIFCSPLPQALSTEAEMLCRYTEGDLDGRDRCIQRVHVTGGTCGILVEDLRKYRPFTPGFIGRAEDQAYLLSVLSDKSEETLRYVHKDGLVMRHDKHAFAGEAIRSARIGKLVGDYIRILVFSHYARILPWSVKKTKDLIDPFTGCFVSYMPFTVVSLRCALKIASFFKESKLEEACALLRMGTRRLHEIFSDLAQTSNPLKEKYLKEKKAWNLYFDLLDKAEEGLKKGDPFALELRERASNLMKACEIDLDRLSGGKTKT